MKSSLQDTRANLSKIIDELAETGPVEITRHGKTVAMIVPAGKTVTAIQSAELEPIDIKVTRIPTASVPPNPKPLKPYQSPSKLVSNTDLERSFTYRPVPKPGTKK